MEAHDVLRRAGVDLPSISAPLAREFTREQLAAVQEFDEVSRSLVASASASAFTSSAASASLPAFELDETDQWQEEREAELERMRLKMAARRGVNPEPQRRDSSWEGYIREHVDEGYVGEHSIIEEANDIADAAPVIDQPGSGRPIEPVVRSKEEMDAAFRQAMVALVEEGQKRDSIAIGMAI